MESMDLCRTCGGELDLDGWDGECGNCADRTCSIDLSHHDRDALQGKLGPSARMAAQARREADHEAALAEDLERDEEAYGVVPQEEEDKRQTLDELIEEWHTGYCTVERDQGWLLSEGSDGCYWLERDDDSARFVDDSMAHGYVLGRAELGDEKARLALAIHFLDVPDRDVFDGPPYDAATATGMYDPEG